MTQVVSDVQAEKDTEPPSRRYLIKQIIENSCRRKGLLDDFFALTNFESLSRNNYAKVWVTASRDNESFYETSGMLTGEFFYENGEELPDGFLIRQQTQKTNRKERVYFDRLRNFRLIR